MFEELVEEIQCIIWEGLEDYERLKIFHYDFQVTGFLCDGCSSDRWIVWGNKLGWTCQKCGRLKVLVEQMEVEE